MASLNDLENLPEIDILEDEGITLESTTQEMIADYEDFYYTQNGVEKILYPADEMRLLINVSAGKFYQFATIINERFKMNFIQYMYGDVLKNWGANFGFTDTGEAYATVTLRFALSETQTSAVGIPAGTRATAGDDIFFATDEYAEIAIGDEYIDVSATCTSAGTDGNGYTVGKLNILADTINYIESVSNTTESSGGRDEYTDDELKEIILNVSDTYSADGTEGGYIEKTKTYSDDILDVMIDTDADAGTVGIYIMLEGGEIPDNTYCSAVETYLYSLETQTDTDKIEVYPPEAVNYTVNLTYYISESNREIASDIQELVEGAVDEFIELTYSSIGYDINPDTLIAYIMAAGAKRVDITTPTFTAVSEAQVGICTDINITYGGLEDD